MNMGYIKHQNKSSVVRTLTWMFVVIWNLPAIHG